jgi:tetratricopeptide (TPR) repeat protein
MPRVPGTHVDDPKQVGRRLREARERAGLSQRDLAFAGCTNAYISRIESGNRIPSLQVIHEFARRLGVSPQYLATGVDEEDVDQALLDAEVAVRLGELDEAREHYRSRLADSPRDPAALGGLGQIAFREGRLTRAIALLEQAIEAREGRLLGDPTAVETLARAHALSGALDAAIALLERALLEAQEADAIVETLRFQVLLANALIDSAELPRAERILADSIRVANDLHDPLATAKVYWSQSRLHSVHKDPQLGARYARRAIEILERTENSAYVALAYQLLAYAEVEAGHAEEALEQIEKGRELFGRDLTVRDDAKFALEECRALLKLGRGKQAAKRAASALGKMDALDPQDRGRGFMLLGEVFRASGDRERALELLELAVAVLEEHGKPFLVDAATRLPELLEELGRPEEALAVLKRAVSASRGTAPVVGSPG